jgi:hypothetical protein
MTLHPTSRAFDLLGVAERLLRDAADILHLDGSADAADLAAKIDQSAAIVHDAGEALRTVMRERFEMECPTRKVKK